MCRFIMQILSTNGPITQTWSAGVNQIWYWSTIRLASMRLWHLPSIYSQEVVLARCKHDPAYKTTAANINVGHAFNTLRPFRRRHILLNENVWISIAISRKFVSEEPNSTIPASVQIMAWRRSGDKPLSEPMVVRLPMHICVTLPQLTKDTLSHPFIILETVLPCLKALH